MPVDRRLALVRGLSVPEAGRGAVLFADISGFTPLTEALARSFGPHRGAEELTVQINRVYEALIAEVNSYAGSVIGFAGDAITCWFDDAPLDLAGLTEGARRAATCALAQQAAMRQFAEVPLPDSSTTSLMLKVLVTSGGGRRFVVGDPQVQLIDVLAGPPALRVGAGDHLAQKGEVLIDAASAAALGADATLGEWRSDEESGERFASLLALANPAAATPWPPALPQELIDEAARAWTLPAVYARLRAGLGAFLTELRPTVALFLRVSGIDLVADPQGPRRFDTFIRWAQRVIARYDASLLQVTVGDKGAYLYASFGAPLAHEDDPRRAVMAALELRVPPAELGFAAEVQIGISRGTMRTGSYGGAGVRAYGSLGDEVNLAARLMTRAAPGEVLASGRVQEPTSTAFVWEALPDMTVKGKSQPVPVARLLDRRQARGMLDEFSGQMVGRQNELAWLDQRVRPILAGRFAGVIALAGEPGMGKSRLVFELRRQLEPEVLWFGAPADGIVRQSLNPLRFFLRAYFDYDPTASEEAQWLRFDARIETLIAATRRPRRGQAADTTLAWELNRTRSLLAALLDLRRPGTLYERLEPRLRFENTLIALRTLVLAECRLRPLVLHLDDAHWLDSDTQELLRVLARDAEAPFALLLSGRSREDGEPFVRLDGDVAPAQISLGALDDDGMRALAAQLLGGPIDDGLAAVLVEKTSANPFFVEQLLLDLRERRALTRDEQGRWQAARAALEAVPDSINGVLVARLDRLAGQVKAVVQTASVLGNEFEVRVLSLMLRDSPELDEVVRQAEADAIWLALSEIRYIFRHGLLRDAAYDMQLRSRLRQLHVLAAEALEQLYADDLDAHAADLAYHYNRAEQAARELRFAHMAGEYAAAQFANAEALGHLSRALELTEAQNLAGRYPLLLLREQVLDRQGEREAQLADLLALRELADALHDSRRQIEVMLRRANYAQLTGDYPAMIVAAEEAIALARAIGSAEGEADGYLRVARARWYQGEYAEGEAQARRALGLARTLQDQRLEADVLRNQGNIAVAQGDYPAALTAYEQGLALHRALGDRQGEFYTLNNIGTVAHYQGDFAAARPAYEQYLAYEREVGDRYGQSLALGNLGEIALAQNDFDDARAFYDQALQICREINDSLGECFTLTYLGVVIAKLGDYEPARATLEQALTLSRDIGHRQQECIVLSYLCKLLHDLGDNPTALEHGALSLAVALEIGDRNTQGAALIFVGHALAGLGKLDEADAAYVEAIELRTTLGQDTQTAEAQAGRVRVALARGDIPSTLALIEPLLPQLVGSGLAGAFEPLSVFLTCYQALAAAGDPRATQVLAAGHAALLAQAASIDDETTRRGFLDQVAIHRELRALIAGLNGGDNRA
jgi:class 3 adenylate cyclase/tetratricopeptide (TPR) repeat protein